MSGIRTLEDLRQRCWVDADTGCWHWRGALDSNKNPSARYPATNKQTSLGVIICNLKTGEGPEPGTCWYCACTTRNCGNPAHRKVGTKGDAMRAHARPIRPDHRARIVAAKRAKAKCTVEAAQAIRASDEPLSVVAARYGLAVSTCSHIRRFKTWKPVSLWA